MLCILFCSTCVVRDLDFDVLRKITGTVRWSCADLRRLPTSPLQLNFTVLCCIRNIFYVFFILVLFTVCKILTFHAWFLIHFLLVVVALPKKTCLSLKNLLVLVILEHGVSVEGKVVEVVLDEEL